MKNNMQKQRGKGEETRKLAKRNEAKGEKKGAEEKKRRELSKQEE